MGGVDGEPDTTAHDHTARIARVAWFCAFVLPLILASLLLGVKSSQASPTAPVEPEPAPLAFEEEIELEEEVEFAEEECEIAKEELEAGELSKAEADAICKEAKEFAKEAIADQSANAECPIRSASAHASTHRGQLKLTIGYTTNTPVSATIQIHGIGAFKRHLGKSGVLRFTGPASDEHNRPVVHIKLPASERAGCTSRSLVLLAR